MDYEHHIFVSYAHGNLWTPWVTETFVPRLQCYLELEVGQLVPFVDEQIQTGARWDNVLKGCVARSKLMLSLLSAAYFRSEWCRREMSLFFEREKKLNLVGRDDNYGLLIPIRLGDGAYFPDVVTELQYHDFEEFADPDLPAGSSRASDFNRNLRKLAKTIARTLPNVPAFCDSWRTFTGNEFFHKLVPKPMAAPTPPRLIV